jgi:predicted RNA-binding protein with PUA-like domain
MKIMEFDASQVSTGYYDPARDEYNTRHITDTRKPVLTLASLNRLKRMREQRKLESLKREDLLSVMYAAPEPEAGGLGGGF